MQPGMSPRALFMAVVGIALVVGAALILFTPLWKVGFVGVLLCLILIKVGGRSG